MEISKKQWRSTVGMGADHSFYVKTIETHARTFLALNILAIGRVYIDHELVLVPMNVPKSWKAKLGGAYFVQVH